MCRISHLVSLLPIAILYTLSAAHQPDPTQLGANVLLRGSHGHFITRTADLFIEDNTSFDQPVAITQTPFVLRALAPYNMHLDPGWDQNGWTSDVRQQKLTEPGTTRLLVDDDFEFSLTPSPIPMPGQPYIVIHEILTYQPSGDDDMSWSLYFERLDDHVNVQLASGNAGNDSGALVGAEARVLQFPAQSP